ncbi:hypothetical protein CR513_02308, partial [Mucuna pruriens]
MSYVDDSMIICFLDRVTINFNVFYSFMEHLDPEGIVLTRLVPSQPSPTSRPKSLQQERDKACVARNKALVHGALVRRIVDQGGVGLEFGKPKPLRLSDYQIGAVVEDASSFCMTRSSSNILYELDPEVDRTLRRLRKVRSFVVSNSSSSNSDNIVSTTNNFDFSEYSSFYINLDPNLVSRKMENNDRTLKELATPDVLEPTQSYELKFGLIHLLPKFHGLVGEDPYKHLKEFHVGILEDYNKMKAFPFSLDGAAKDWLYLQPVLFNTWGDMKRMFLEKFFLASKTTTIRKEICGIRQHYGETLHE